MNKNIATFQRESIKKWFEDHRFEAVEKATYNTDTQTEEVKPETREMGTQTETWHQRAQSLETITAMETYEDFKKVENLAWADELYTNSAVWNQRIRRCIQRLYKDKYPELADLNGQFEIIEQRTYIRTKTPVEETIKKIIKIVHNGTPEKIWEALRLLKSETSDDERVAIHHIVDYPTDKLKKMVEGIFHGSRTIVDIYTIAGYHAALEKTDKRERPTFGMIVSGGRSYKDILGKVKNAVGDKAAGGAIRSLKSTRDGSLLIVMDKDQKSLNEIKKAFKDSPEGLKARQVGEEGLFETLHVRGMEAECTKQELQQALTEKLGKWDEDTHKLSDLRPMVSNQMAATVTIPTK
ncbi:unnamed protein product [Psylliodes chrysocephalus]|uniref:Uncharacterized protein n=1 Tax=Psylliodes chrysocephalus TaxID=3402493 RepID=A0A9P0CV65_9CUCU|nr:unnamed protein product [Psylliodes chrysocephala]